jgi:hypothetical protein
MVSWRNRLVGSGAPQGKSTEKNIRSDETIKQFRGHLLLPGQRNSLSYFSLFLSESNLHIGNNFTKILEALEENNVSGNGCSPPFF